MSLQDYLDIIENEEKKEYFSKIVTWINEEYPQLDLVIKWNQPMFVMEGVFIISLNASEKYISVSIEKPLLDELREDIEACGYEVLNMVFHIKYTDEVNFKLLTKIIDKIIDVKKDSKGFWL